MVTCRQSHPNHTIRGSIASSDDDGGSIAHALIRTTSIAPSHPHHTIQWQLHRITQGGSIAPCYHMAAPRPIYCTIPSDRQWGVGIIGFWDEGDGDWLSLFWMMGNGDWLSFFGMSGDGDLFSLF